MSKLPSLLAVAIGLAAAVAAQEAPPAGHAFIAPDDIQWGPGPPGLPPGAKSVVLTGNPGGDGLFVVRAWLPAGWSVPPHWHPTAESVTVISGEGHFGLGDTMDKTAGETIPAGGFAYMPATMHHSFWVETDTVIQVHAWGPFQITYVNPSDDPRNQAAQ